MDDPRIARIFGENGSLARALASHSSLAYEARHGQLLMANAVLDTLRSQGIALMEAGTGVGKSLAYLIPAVLSGARVVVSTATLALQEQLMREDIPKLLALPELNVEEEDFAVLKGLNNYLCLRRYDELLQSAESVARPRIAKSLPMLAHFRAETVSGDREDGQWAYRAETLADVWQWVNSGQETRIGPRCLHHDECFVTLARERAEKARIIVVNHHLFFADLALRRQGRSVLPNYGAVVFDEAHHIDDVANQFFSTELSLNRIERFVHDVEHGLPRRQTIEFESVLRSVLLRAGDLFRARVGNAEARTLLDPEQPRYFEVQQLALALEAALEVVELQLQGLTGEGPHLEVAAENATRARKIRTDIATIFDAQSVDELVRYLEIRNQKISYCAAPREVGALLAEELLAATDTAIFTSATLTAPISRASEPPPRIESEEDENALKSDVVNTASPFYYFRNRIGLTENANVSEYSFASPFNFASQCALYLPEMPDPRAPDFFTLAAEEILELVHLSKGGAFILTTSFRMLEDLRLHIGSALAQIGPLLVQNSASKGELLTRFKAAENAILLGTSTFWEGVDVPGRALRLVVLDRLPFLVPSDPKVMARAERIRERFGNPFRELFLPHAMIALKQGFGRLVRSNHDRGVVAILDGRIRSKGYGKVLLRGLPDAKVVMDREELAPYWVTDTL